MKKPLNILSALALSLIINSQALTPQELLNLQMACSKEITLNTSAMRKEVSKLESSYNRLKELQVTSDPTYQQLASQKDDVQEEINNQGSSDSLINALQSINSQLMAQRASISDSDTLQTIQGDIQTKQAVLNSLKVQVMSTSTACQQAYDSE